MLNLEEWLRKKQKMSINTFATIPDKKAYYEEYDKYKARAARFNAMVITDECREAAREIIALGD